MIVATRLSSPKSRQFIAWYRCKKANRPVGNGMTGSDRRATIRTINQLWVGINRSLRDGFSMEPVPAPKAFGAGYHHSVPPGRAPFELTNPKAAYLGPSLSLRVLRVFVVNRNQALTPIQPHLIKP